MKTACPFYIVFQALKVVLIVPFVKICKIQPPDLFLLFLLTFTSADIISHKVLELHSMLSEEKIYVPNFP